MYTRDAVVLEVQKLGVLVPGGHRIGPVSFTLKAGDMAGLSGPNGSGKTTVLRVIAGLQDFSSGAVIPNREQRIWPPCFAGNHPLPCSGRTAVGKGVASWHRLFGVRSPALDIPSEWSGILSGSLSAGQRAFATLASLLDHQAPLWLLDEPWTWLDNKRRSQLAEACQRHVCGGGTVLFSSHEHPDPGIPVRWIPLGF